MPASFCLSTDPMTHRTHCGCCADLPGPAVSRRDLLGQFATGLGGAVLAALLTRQSAADAIAPEASDPPPHHPPKAKRAIQIFLQGGLSQVDSFDYKPELERLHGKAVPGDEKPQAFMGKVG